MAIIELPDEVIEFMRDLAREIKEQDNRGTASPYFYIIQGQREHVAADGCGEKVGYYDSDSCENNTKAEMVARYEEWLKEQVDEGVEPTQDDRYRHSFDDYIRAFDIQTYDIGYHDCEENVFLTERGVEQHMGLNRHNYRHLHKLTEKGYVKHAFRNPEMKQLLESIMAFLEVAPPAPAEPDTRNKEEVYDEDITPHLVPIMDACQKHKIAMLAQFCIPTPEAPALMCTSALISQEYQAPDNMQMAAAVLKDGARAFIPGPGGKPLS